MFQALISYLSLVWFYGNHLEGFFEKPAWNSLGGLLGALLTIISGKCTHGFVIPCL